MISHRTDQFIPIMQKQMDQEQHTVHSQQSITVPLAWFRRN